MKRLQIVTVSLPIKYGNAEMLHPDSVKKEKAAAAQTINLQI